MDRLTISSRAIFFIPLFEFLLELVHIQGTISHPHTEIMKPSAIGWK